MTEWDINYRAEFQGIKMQGVASIDAETLQIAVAKITKATKSFEEFTIVSIIEHLDF